jgi:hypothetical protein
LFAVGKHRLKEGTILTDPFEGYVGVSLDREHLGAAEIVAMNSEIKAFLDSRPDKFLSVYINPREVPGVAAHRLQIGHGNGNDDAEMADYTTTLDLLGGAPNRACVIIPAYPYVPADGIAEREHGVNVWDCIGLAHICVDRGVPCVMAMGVWDYARNSDIFRENLFILHRKLPPQATSRFAYFELVAPPAPASYHIVPGLLDDVRKEFGHL